MGECVKITHSGRLAYSARSVTIPQPGTSMTGAAFSRGSSLVSLNHTCRCAGLAQESFTFSVLPEAPNKQHIGEFKTHSLKSFNDVEAKGVEKSKPEHYAQMQVYMHGTGIDRALYVAVCKDNDRIYTERVRYDQEMAEKLVARGKRLALSERMPPPISTDPTWFQCKFCDAHSFCHETQLTEHVNCRTCAHSTPKDDSTWHCERWGSEIAVEYQHKGCEAHTLHPDLVPWHMFDGTDWVAVYEIDGRKVRNGEGEFSSRELIANAKGCADPMVQKVKKIWPKAEVVKNG